MGRPKKGEQPAICTIEIEGEPTQIIKACVNIPLGQHTEVTGWASNNGSTLAYAVRQGLKLFMREQRREAKKDLV